MTQTQIAKEMAKSISTDLGLTVGLLVAGISRLAAMPIVGNLPESVKDNIYLHDNAEIYNSRGASCFATGTSIVGNVALAATNAALTGNDTLDKVILGYTLVDGTCRAIMMLGDKAHSQGGITPKSPGSLIGCMVGYPLLGLQNYVVSKYHEAEKVVAGK